MEEVFKFDKSLQQRLEEYTEILSGYEILPTSSLQREWSLYLDLVVDPNGWQAIWKIPRKTCELHNIPFPTVVLVVIINLDLRNLKALVKVLMVQDDIHIPAQHYACLIHLWPTKEQDRTVALNIEQSANALDNLRFFYNYLLMPWDYDEDDNSDWRSKHLESRLRLCYDLKNGIIERPIAEYVSSLLNEARHLQAKREILEVELNDYDDDEEEADSSDKNKIDELLEIQIRMLKIKNEIETFENPLLRNIVIKNMKEELALELAFPTTNESNIWVIFEEGLIEECIDFFKKIQMQYPTKNVKLSNQLQSCLRSGNMNDVYILNESEHFIKTTGSLQSGGILRGVSDSTKSILRSNTEDVMLDFNGQVLLENITIDVSSAQYAIIVRGGLLKINNCHIIGNRKSSSHHGIIVLPGAKLEITNSKIYNFAIAIIGNSNSKISITDCDIYDVWCGLKVFDLCYLEMERTTIRNCKDYGVRVETDTLYPKQDNLAAFDILKIIPHVKVDSIQGYNNSRGDAIIHQRPTIKPIENLFEDPNFDMSSSEHMEGNYNLLDYNTDGDDRLSPNTI